ncbi:MAG TPA: tetratricopeptide repeat protein [Armatimonadota bacterium]|nr:tetratricopeptide repeat protein [Armatimonadota bacterium]
MEQQTDELIATGELMELMENYSAAIQCYRAAVEQAPELSSYGLTIAGLLLRQGETSAALAEARAAGLAAPDDPDDQYHLARVLLEVGLRAEAIEAYRRTLEIEPDHVDAARFLGELLLHSGAFEQAIDVLRRGLQHAPDAPTAAKFHWLLGCAFAHLGLRDDAWDAWEAFWAIEDAPLYLQLAARQAVEKHPLFAGGRPTPPAARKQP